LAQGRVRRTDRAEPGLAAELLRVRDHRRGTWCLAGCRDYWSKYEHRFHISATANRHDAIAAVELALAGAAELFGRPVADLDADGNVVPVATIVTDNGGRLRAFRFEAFIATHAELRHVRTAVKSPGQNGSRERGFGSLKYERLFLEEVPDDRPGRPRRGLPHRAEHRPPPRSPVLERPLDVHLGLADPTIPNSSEPHNLPST
jgi:transposase InsO family protein